MKAFFLALIFALSAHAQLKTEIVFNEPGFHDQEAHTVEDKLVDLIEDAAPDSSVHMSMYQVSRTAVVEALIRASQRGVDVRLVLDGSNYFDHRQPGSGTDILLNGSTKYGRLECKEQPCVHFCSGPVHLKLKKQTFGGSCNGLVINHNKFFLFSKLRDGSENVVAQTSENLEDEMQHEYQDLIIIRDDKGLYDGYLSYWGSQNRDHTRLTPWKDAIGTGPVVAKFFPRIINKDPVLQMLRRVSCGIPGPTIRIAEANFNRVKIADRLRKLAQQGCDVKVITKIEPKMFSPTLSVVKRLGSNIMIMPYQGKTPEYQLKNSIHLKIIAIDAAVDHSPVRRQFVLTGSHNLDFFSLHTNDETVLILEDTPAYLKYFEFWNRLNFSARNSGLHLLEGRDVARPVSKL